MSDMTPQKVWDSLSMPMQDMLIRIHTGKPFDFMSDSVRKALERRGLISIYRGVGIGITS